MFVCDTIHKYFALIRVLFIWSYSKTPNQNLKKYAFLQTNMGLRPSEGHILKEKGSADRTF